MWLTDLSIGELHGLAWKLYDQWKAGRTSTAQDWLFDRAVRELRYRRRRQQWNDRRCACQFCWDWLENPIFGGSQED